MDLRTEPIKSAKLVRFTFRSMFLFFIINSVSFALNFSLFAENYKFLCLIIVSTISGLSMAWTRSFIDTKKGFSKYFLYTFLLVFGITAIMLYGVLYLQILL